MNSLCHLFKTSPLKNFLLFLICEYFKKIYFSSEQKNFTKQVKLEIDISDFFVLNHFQPDGKANYSLQLNLKSPQVLMSGMLAEEMLEICKEGGIEYLFLIYEFLQ